MSQSRGILRRFDDFAVPLPVLIRLFVGGLFVYMGVVKIGDPVAFLKQVRLYEMLPETPPYWLNGTAVVLPWIEVVCGIALILGIARRGAGLSIAVMLCVFTPAIFLRAMAIHQTDGTPFFQIAFDCGCGGGPQIIWLKLLKNTGLLLLVLLLLFSGSRRFSLAALFDRGDRTVAHCRRCGHALPIGADGLCPTCRELPTTGAVRSDTAS